MVISQIDLKSKYKTSLFFFFKHLKEGYVYNLWKATVKGIFEQLNQLKQVFKILLWKLTFNRLKPRFNQLNGFSSYTTNSKNSFKNSFVSKVTNNRLSQNFNRLFFPLHGKTLSSLKQIKTGFCVGIKTDLT